MTPIVLQRPVTISAMAIQALKSVGALVGTAFGRAKSLGTARQPSGIIVADDDPFVGAVLRTSLKQLNQDVFLASDGLEAVALASRMRASLVILDIRMPGLDGLHACSRIRELPGYATTPIVMLTIDDTEQSQRTALRAGATMYLAKPFAEAGLMSALSRFLPIGAAAMDAIHAASVRAAGGRVFRKPNT